MSDALPAISLTDDLTTLQENVAARLRSDPYFADVEVLCENLGDIETLINIALANAGGCYVLVMTPVARVTEPNIPGPFFSEVVLQIRCGEVPQINRSTDGRQKSAQSLAVRALNRLHHWTPTDHGQCLYADRNALVPAPSPEGEITFDAFLKSSA